MAEELTLKKQKTAKCEECPDVAPLYLATFSDMAILLMAFFVLLLSQAIVSPDAYDEQSLDTFETGVQAEVEAYNQATAESIVLQQFQSAPVDPTVFDIIEEDRTDETQPDDLLKRDSGAGESDTNALEIVEQRLAREIARGTVEIREEDSKLIVEITENFGEGDDRFEAEAKSRGEVNAELMELYLQIAVTQSASGATLQVMGGSPLIEESGESFEADDTTRVYRDLLLALDEDIKAGQLEVKRVGSDVILTLPSANGFVSGSSSLQPTFLPLLNRIGDALMPIRRMVRIEGHTDNLPLSFGSMFRSNWDLSSARAASVADYFLEQRYRVGGELYISGFGEARPVESNDTAAGRAANRRIEIVLPKGVI
ncbi:MAG: OmpA family protein [Pseudomonadota bacterium]|nr:OmpA family protein [Pseudomonadota bacterium]